MRTLKFIILCLGVIVCFKNGELLTFKNDESGEVWWFEEYNKIVVCIQGRCLARLDPNGIEYIRRDDCQKYFETEDL